VWQARDVDATDARHRAVVTAAWRDYGDPRAIVAVDELSAMVSTNRVYRLQLDDGTRVIVKSSNYGSFFLFAEDHERLHLANRLLGDGPYGRFLADAYTRGGKPYIWYDGEMWAIFYEEIEARQRLPRILTDAQVARLATELARFHKACAAIAPQIPPPSKTAKSDAVNLFEQTGARNAAQQFALDRSRIDLVRRHTHRFLMSVHESGYGPRVRLRRVAEDAGPDRLEPRQLLRRVRSRRRLALPPVQPMGLRLVPDRVEAARLLLPLARVVADG
jgi:hypothetical protein